MIEAAQSSLEPFDAVVRRLLEPHADAAEVVGEWLGAHTDPAHREALLERLKDESERLLAVDTAAADVLANALVLAAHHLSKPSFKALGLMAQGDVRRAQGRYAETVALMDAAGEAFMAQGDEIGWARSRIGWVFASQFRGRGREAVPVAEEAYAVLARAGEHLRAGSMSTNTAGVYYHLGQYEHALAVYDRAIWHFQQLLPALDRVADERIAKAMANKALTLMLLGHFGQAIELCQAAREIFIRCGELASALRVDHFRASIYAGQGQYTRALRVQADALAEFERAGLDESVIQVTLDMIGCQAGLNRHTDALALAESLASRCESVGARTEAAKARFRSAQARAALGDVHGALAALAVATEVFAAAGLSAELGSVTLLRARLLCDEKDWAAAQALAERAFDLFAERGLVERRTEAELIRADAALALGDHGQAEVLARAALDTSRSLDAPLLSHSAHHILARAAGVKGQTDRALDEYESAVRDLEQVQSSLTTELRTEFLGDKLHLFHDAIEFSIDHNELARGLDYLERAKSRALVEYLANQPELPVPTRTNTEREQMAELNRLREEHHWFYGRLHGAGGLGESRPLAEPERATLQQAVADREQRMMKIHERLALLRNSQGLESIGPHRNTDHMALPRLPDGTILLEYVFWEDRGAVFIVTSSGLAMERLAIGSRGLQRLLSRWYLNLESSGRAIGQIQQLDRLTQNANGLLRSLYDALLKPVASYLDGMEQLIVVPYGPSHAVPFHALFDGHRYLTEQLEVWTTPSSSLLNLCSQRARRDLGTALVLGYSGGFLPGVLDEARRVSALLGGACYLEADATREVVLEEGPKHQILHLAAHGEARLDNPVFAHISLADGQLGMADIFNIRLDGAMVTLSACETGRSAVVGGDELVGLSRGFLFAGASTLVQSLWRVDDVSTAALMEKFYTLLRAGKAPGAALRAAQRSSLELASHPYLWAPFQVVGYGG